MKLKIKKLFSAVLIGIVLGAITGLVLPRNSFAQASPDPVPVPTTDDEGLRADNIVMGDPLVYGWRYQKTIDMTNAPDKSKIPNARFSYTLHAVSQSPTSGSVESGATPKPAATGAAMGVGTTYTSTSIGTYEVRPGLFPNGIQTLPVSKVTFRPIDFYWNQLEDYIDHNRPEKTLDFIVNHAWGEMRSSDHVHTVIVRQPTDSERAAHAIATSTYASWDKNMSPWHMSHEVDRSYLTPEGYYRPDTPANLEAGGEFLGNEVSFLPYTRSHKLREVSAVTFYPYALRAPFVSRLRKDATGNITSVSKPLFSAEELEDLRAFLHHTNAQADEKIREASGTYGIRRYILREDPVPAGFKNNTQQLVLDYFPATDTPLLFNSVEQADAFYRKAFVDRFDDANPDASYFANVEEFMQTAPFAGFVNTYVPQPAAPRGDDRSSSDRSHTATSTPATNSTHLSAQPPVSQQSGKQKVCSTISANTSQVTPVAASGKLVNVRPAPRKNASAKLPQTYDTSVSGSLVAGVLGAAALLLLCAKRAIRCEF